MRNTYLKRLLPKSFQTGTEIESEKNEKVYRMLQRHLDSQAVGFPATRKGYEIEILKHIFTPGQAQIAMCLSHRNEPIQSIYARAGQIVSSEKELEGILAQIQRKGGIETTIQSGEKVYRNAPLIPGMYEFQNHRMTPEFVENFTQYANEKFGLELLSTVPNQFRTIPIEKSVNPKNNVSTYDQISRLIEESDGPFTIHECICRHKKAVEGEPCKVTDRKEICLAINDLGHTTKLMETGREITKEEALLTIKQNQKEGLVLQTSNTEKPDFICACCGCCCGMLDIHKQLPIPKDFWVSNFHASVESENCDGCGVCKKRCQVEAITFSKTENKAVVDTNRCLGCGNCIPTCPKKAIELVNNKEEVRPPKDKYELTDIIMKNKKSSLGKIKLQGKILFDMVRIKSTKILRT